MVTHLNNEGMIMYHLMDYTIDYHPCQYNLILCN